jgi:hypothetical protein
LPPGFVIDEPSATKDIAKSAAAGVGKGVAGLVGFIGDASNAGAKGLEAATNYISDKLGVSRYERPQGPSALDYVPTGAATQRAMERITGEFYKPQTTAGKYAETIGELAPGLIGGPTGIARRALTNVIVPGAASEAAGQATEGSAAEPYARVAAAMVGGVIPSVAARAITPLPASAARQRLVDVLQGEGVNSLTAGQRTGSDALRYAESTLGNGFGAGGRTNRMIARGQEEFTDAAMRRAGASGPATPEALAANYQRLGDTFNDLSARNTLVMDKQFVRDVNDATRLYDRVPPSQQKAIVQGYQDDILQHARNGGAMPGAYYQEMRSRLSRQSKAVSNSDPTLSEALRDLRNALDDTMGRSIAPADQQAWQNARREYAAQKVIEKTASRAGEATAEGNLVPANLRNTVSAEDRGAYARGQGPFSELARAGSAIMAPMPQSGTAPRLAMHSVASMLGGLMGSASGPGLGTVAGAVAGPALAGRALMSRPVQSYLGNQAMTGAMRNLTPGQSAVIAALMEAEQQRLSGASQPR